MDSVPEDPHHNQPSSVVQASIPEMNLSNRISRQRHQQQSPPHMANGEMQYGGELAGNNQSNPKDEEVREPGQLSNLQGQPLRSSPSPRASAQIKQAQTVKLSPGS